METTTQYIEQIETELYKIYDSERKETRVFNRVSFSIIVTLLRGLKDTINPCKD